MQDEFGLWCQNCLQQTKQTFVFICVFICSPSGTSLSESFTTTVHLKLLKQIPPKEQLPSLLISPSAECKRYHVSVYLVLQKKKKII